MRAVCRRVRKFAYDGPTFRTGLWKFERTLETNGKSTDRRQPSGLLIDRQTTLCVNPTNALEAEFTPLEVGACNTRHIRKTDNGYVFQKVCGRVATNTGRSGSTGTRRGLPAAANSRRKTKSPVFPCRTKPGRKVRSSPTPAFRDLSSRRLHAWRAAPHHAR